jgi:D-serine deaminase-like pyridoxal phosphate-dependent protein
MKTKVSRRGFFATSAAAGALGIVTGRRGAAAQAQAGEDALVAPPYRGFLKKNMLDLPTPALLIDLDIFEHNLQALSTFMKGKSTTFRPHGKAHKSSAIGKLQIASGARGLCAAKLGEADVLIRGGIKDVLITAEVVGTLKIKRLMELLAITPDVKVVVDNEQNAIDLSTAALAAKKKLKVLIDVNVGQNRTGVEPADADKLAQVIAKQKGLELLGLQGYGGNNQHIVGFDDRKARETESNEKVVSARHALETAGFGVQIVSVGGTGSYNIDADFPGVTEIQPGSYVFMDSHYNKIGGKTDQGNAFTDFGNSLSVLTTVISRAVGVNPAAAARAAGAGAAAGGRAGGGRAVSADPRPVVGRAVVDAGIKSLSNDESTPEPLRMSGATYGGSGDEYGALSFRDPAVAGSIKVGDKVQITPGHCDTTVNLYNVFYGVRNGIVEHVWPIEGRGRTD